MNPLVYGYANVVNSNSRWDWNNDITGGASLTKTQKSKIKHAAIDRGLIPNIQMKPGTNYTDFETPGLIVRIDYLPRELWDASDPVQFRLLNNRIPGGQPIGYTWHHSEIPGKMELVPFGIHNIVNHIVGRSKNHW